MDTLDLQDQVSRMTAAERLELISALWDSLDHEAFSVTTTEAAMLDERLADYEANPTAGRPASEVITELRAMYT